jgi:exodeoxyribonuclease VII small subunit
MSATDQKLETLSFEDGLSELETIVRDLESGNAPLDNAIQSFERGMALKKHCESKLREAQSKIEKITIQDDGTAKAVPLETAE